MTIRAKVFLGILLVVAPGFYFLVDWIVDDLTPQYRESTEEPLVDTARILASVAAASVVDDKINLELFQIAFDQVYNQSFEARIYGFVKRAVDLRIYLTDANGIVIFDSDGGRDEGKDYSQWRDVRLTLEGEYGARTSRDIPGEPKNSIMYVSAPVMVGGEIFGVLTVGKPTKVANMLIEAARSKILIGGSISAATVILVGLWLSGMITRPIKKLTDYARGIKRGERIALPNLGKGEIRELGQAFEDMREALEGKQYVERYVQTLTHEIKSPLSAIRGAVELLEEDMPAENKMRFYENIKNEGARIQMLIDKLLMLSSLENQRTIIEPELVELNSLVEDVVSSFNPLFEAKNIIFKLIGGVKLHVQGDRLLIRQAISNVVRNSLEFCPLEGRITVKLESRDGYALIVVNDSGPGIPDYAIERVFERFYSLKREDTGRKSSGLGLSIVKEVVSLHNGKVGIRNLENGGVGVELWLPL